MGLREKYYDLSATLVRERDHLKVRSHLFKAELRDEWEEAEKSWHHFQDKIRHISKTGGESAADVADTVRELGEKLQATYKRIRDAI